MAPKRIISQHQLEILISFMEGNREFALRNRNIRGVVPISHSQIAKAWDDLALKLNSCESYGMLKTAQEWKRYWHLLKCRTKAKAADQRRKEAVAGAGSNVLAPLADFEERIISLLHSELVDDGVGDTEVLITENVSDEDLMEMDPFESINDDENVEACSRTSSPEAEIPDHTYSQTDHRESLDPQERKHVVRQPCTSLRTEAYISEKTKLNGKIHDFGHRFYKNKVDFLKIKIQEEELNHQRDMHKAELKYQQEMHQQVLKYKEALHMEELKYKQEVHKEELKHKQEIHVEELKMKVKEREYLVKNWDIGVQSALRTANSDLYKRDIN